MSPVSMVEKGGNGRWCLLECVDEQEVKEEEAWRKRTSLSIKVSSHLVPVYDTGG
jgi:hypothetical protein